MELQEQQARALAFLLHEVRPDWPVPSLLAQLEKNRVVPSLGALIVAATTKALEPSCKTPAPIFQPGPHWPADTTMRTKQPPCQDHPTETAHNCRCCWSEVKTRQRPETHIGRKYPEAVTQVAASSTTGEKP